MRLTSRKILNNRLTGLCLMVLSVYGLTVTWRISKYEQPGGIWVLRATQIVVSQDIAWLNAKLNENK